MYLFTVFNYEKKENKAIYMGSYYNCINTMENEIHNYIMSNCGKTSQTIKYDDLVFNYND